MHLICKNNITEVYDDGDVYRTKYVNGSEPDEIIEKSRWLAYPLALALKWGYEPVDVEYLNRLSDELDEKYGRER